MAPELLGEDKLQYQQDSRIQSLTLTTVQSKFQIYNKKSLFGSGMKSHKCSSQNIYFINHGTNVHSVGWSGQIVTIMMPLVSVAI